MKSKVSRMWRSGVAMLLALCLVAGFFPTAAFAVETEETLHYVSLGASNTNGYGLDGYLPGEVYEDPLAASKANLNVYGYGRAPETAYPAQVAAALEAETSKTVELHQLAISSMRVEEVRYLLDDTMNRDAYIEWRFTGGDKWFEIAEPGGIDELKKAYRDSLTKADVVTVDLGWNNFGVFAFNHIKTIMADGRLWLNAEDYPRLAGYPFDITDYMDPKDEPTYQKVKASAMEKLTANMSGADSGMKAKLELMADVLAAATMGACYNYDIVMEKIYELNPDAKVVVINIQNLADDLVIDFEGSILPLGDLYGELIDFVNLYRASKSPYADKCIFADIGDVTTFLDELVAWDGDPTTLSDDTKDCFDMYDDNLYVRSIVEYMMVGQALSGVFNGVQTQAATYGLNVFADDSNYTYNFALQKTTEQLLALDLSKLDLSNPADDDADVETYGKALAPHLVNLRAKNFDAYDYVFDNLKSSLGADYHSTVDTIQQKFKTALEGVYNTYINTLNYAYDVVATIFQEAAKINNLEVDAESMKGFNDVADDLMEAIAGSFINGAQAKFYYELQKNSVQNTGVTEDPEVAVSGVLDLMKNADTAAIAVLAVRYELGNSFFAHPNPEGHDEITDAVMNALKNGSDAGDFTDGKISVYKAFLKEKYPNLYSMVMGAQNIGEVDDLAIIIALLKATGDPALDGVDLDALEANIRAAYRDYAQSKTPEQMERAEEVAFDLTQRLYDLAAVISGSDYKITEGSYYVSLGDSTINGYGLDGYIDNMHNGVNQVVANSAHVLLAKEIYGEAWMNHFGNFCQGSLRADDLLLFLGGEVELDDYYYAEIAPNLMEGTLEATQEKFIKNVEKADLISVAIGGGNFLTFAGKYVNRVLGNTEGDPYELDWERIGVDSTDESMKELQEVLDLLVPIVDELGLMDQYLPEGVEIENPAKFSRALAEGLIYGFASYNYYYSKVLDRIKEINPDAQLLILGMFNPVDDWSMTTTIDGQETYIPIGGAIGNLIGSANLQSLAYALQNTNTAYIDVSDAETILEAEKPGVQLGFNDYYNSSFQSNGKAVHASVGGHKYIANQMAAALSTESQIRIILEELYDLVETYGPEVAAQVWNQWVEYGYVEAVETTVNKLKDKLNERYTYYTETALPAIEAAVDALAAEKDNLTDELAALKVRLEEKKAELEKVISEQEIGSIHTPNIGIDAELGNNEQTTVSDRECVVDGEGIEAELNAAIKDIEHAIATVEALIADIGADIEDMIALAEQIAAAVAELEKTMADIAAAAEDLANAVQAVVEVLANSDGVIDAVISTFEAGRDTALAAAEVLELTMGVAEDMMGDIDEMIEIIVTDAEALYNKFLTDLPGCIDQIPEEGKMLIGGAILAAQKGLEEGKKLIEAELPGKIAELKAEYADDLAALKAEYEGKITQAEADLEALKAQVQIEIDAKYAEVSEQIKAEYNARIVELEARLEALEAELQGYKTELENLAADAEEAVRQQLQAQIDRVTGDIATVKEDLECALEHLENALQIAYEEIVAEVTAIYEEAMAELQKAADDLKAALEQAAQELKDALDKAVEELKAAADKAIEDLTAEYEKLVAELEKIGEELSAALNGILESIRDELTAAQQAIEEILKGNLEAVEALADALAALGAEALAELVEDIVDIVEAMLEEATTADLVIDDDFKYVAIGDGSAATESYVEKLAAALNAEAAENGVDGIEVANNAKAGNTVAAERANLSDVSDADLITVGFSNVEFLDKAVVSAVNGVAMDWSVIVGEENVRYIDELMAEVADMVAEAGVEGENAVLINTAIEAYAYAAVQYATELPELINDIHAANPEALIIIVGMYNPMKGVTVALNENTTLDIGEYIDYLVQGVAVHGIAYAILTGNAIYVDAPSVDTENVDTELSILELAAMALNKFVALYPSATGDDYVAEEIADALNITYIKSEPAGLLGDANGDGKVLANDAMLVLQYSVSDITADELNLAVCDVNGDGKVLANDAMLILQRSVDPNAKFPIE